MSVSPIQSSSAYSSPIAPSPQNSPSSNVVSSNVTPVTKKLNDGSIVTYTYTNNQRDGSAMRTFADGSFQEFQCVAGKSQGAVKHTFTNGSFLEFQTVNGRITSLIKRTFVNKAISEYQDPEIISQGAFTYNDPLLNLTITVSTTQPRPAQIAQDFIGPLIESLLNNYHKIIWDDNSILSSDSILGPNVAPVLLLPPNIPLPGMQKTEQTSDGCMIAFKDNQGQRQGHGKIVHNGQTLICRFVNDRKWGPARIFYNDGRILEFLYVEDKPQGEAKITFKDGSLQTFRYINGKRHGPAKQIYPEGHFQEFEYVEDKIPGIVKTTFPNGATSEYPSKDERVQKEFIYKHGFLELRVMNSLPQGIPLKSPEVFVRPLISSLLTNYTGLRRYVPLHHPLPAYRDYPDFLKEPSPPPIGLLPPMEDTIST